MPTTTTMALSSPLNLTSLTVSSQVSAIKDESADISPQLTQQLDMANACETAQLSSPNSDDRDDIIKATVNGNILKNGAISSLMTEQGSPKMSIHSPITMVSSSMSSEIDADLNIKNNDMGCLNVVTSSSPTSLSSGVNNNHFLNGNNGHLLMAQSGASLNFQASNSPDNSSSWSIGEVENSSFVNYSSTNNGQMHKRPIMSQQPHHGLSPNSSIGRNNASQQQYIHYNKNNGNSNNYSAPWSNSGPWQQQQQMQHQQQLLHQSSSQASINNWNRGRSVPNLNPLSPHVPPHQRKHQPPVQYSMPPSASSSQGLSPNSPSKYRRSTSYPGKNQNMHGYPMDPVAGIIEDQGYMSYQVCSKIQ